MIMWDRMLNNKTAVVTGAASGIGYEISLLFAKHGAENLLLIDVNNDGLFELHEQVTSTCEGCNVHVASLDASDDDHLARINSETFPCLYKVDILVNNLGVDLFKGFFETTYHDYDRVNNINCRSAFFITQKIAKYMKKRQQGAIIFMSSVNAILGNTNHSAYTVSKGGLVSLARALAIDLGTYNITVNSVLPGSIDTPMFQDAVKTGLEKSAIDLGKIYPIGRIGRADEVASLVLFLVSDMAKFITGVNIPIDGGYSAK